MHISHLKKFLLYFKAPSIANSLLAFLTCSFLFLALPAGGLKYILFLKFPETTYSLTQFVNESCCTNIISFASNIIVNGKPYFVYLPYVFFIIIGVNLFFVLLCAILLQYISQIKLRDIGVTWSLGHGYFLKNFGIALASGLGFLFFIILGLNILHLGFGMNEFFQYNPLGKIDIQLFIAPYSEEFFFRGVLFVLLVRHHWRISSIIICTGLLFGVTHLLCGLDFLFSTYTVIVGIYLGWLYHKTGSLILPFLIHIIGNGLIQLVRFYPQIMNKIIVGI